MVYREILEYYSGPVDEDAYGQFFSLCSLQSSILDMRKALTMDIDKKSIIPLPNPVHAKEVWLEQDNQNHHNAGLLSNILYEIFGESQIDLDLVETIGGYCFFVSAVVAFVAALFVFMLPTYVPL